MFFILFISIVKIYVKLVLKIHKYVVQFRDIKRGIFMSEK